MDQIQYSTCPTPTTPTRTAHSSASTLATRRVINARVTFCGTVRHVLFTPLSDTISLFNKMADIAQKADINNANEHINCVLFDDM